MESFLDKELLVKNFLLGLAVAIVPVGIDYLSSGDLVRGFIVIGFSLLVFGVKVVIEKFIRESDKEEIESAILSRMEEE